MDLKLLKQLTEVNGISGNEGKVSLLFQKAIEESVDAFDKDKLGSTIGIRKGVGTGSIMLAGHMDEVGFLVSGIHPRGYIKVFKIGGWWNHVILAQRVVIETREGKKFYGVFGAPAPHVLPPEARGKVVDDRALYIDIGVYSKEEVLKLGIQVGDTVTPISSFEVLANPDFVLGKAFDDRIGVFIIAEVLRKLKGEKVVPTVYAVATVQEEVGLRGARTSGFKINPDIALAIDVTLAQDLPENVYPECKLGGGVALSIADGSAIAHRGLLYHLKKIAQEASIPYTLDVLSGGGTDTGEIHKSHDGVIAMTLSIPSRHIHSSNSIINLVDVQACIDLIVKFILSYNEETYKTIQEN